MRAMLEALAALHANGLVHRNLHWRHVLFGTNGPFVISFDKADYADQKARCWHLATAQHKCCMLAQHANSRTRQPATVRKL